MRGVRVLTVVLALVLGGAAPPVAEPAPPEARFQTGTTMAFLRGWVEDDAWRYQIWRRDPTTDVDVQVTADPGLLPYTAELSPTSHKIAFTVGYGSTVPQPALLLTNLDGSGRRNLLAGQGRVTMARNPSWSPDGKRLVFAGITPGSNHELFTIDASGKNLRQVTTCSCAWENTPRWSPTRNEVLWSPNTYDLAVLDLDTGQSTQVYDNRPSGHLTVSDYRWSPTGEQIVLTASAWNDAHPDVYVIDRDGTDLRQVASQEGVSFSGPVYSPDGSLIAVNADSYDELGDRTRDIWWFEPEPGLQEGYGEMDRTWFDELASWQPGPLAGAPTGGKWSELTVAHEEIGDYVYVSGGLMPGRSATKVRVVLEKQVTKKRATRWKPVRTATATTSPLSTYLAELRRTSGLCRLTVSWPGDAGARPAQQRSKPFGC